MAKIRTLAAPVVLAAVALAACGSGLTAHPATPTTAAQAPVSGTPTGSGTPSVAPEPDAAFAVLVTGTSQPLPDGREVHASLSASLRLLSHRSEICWTFSKVTGVTHPTKAYVQDIYGDLLGRLGTHYTTRGCAAIAPNAAQQIFVDSRDSELVVVSDHFTDHPLYGTL